MFGPTIANLNAFLSRIHRDENGCYLWYGANDGSQGYGRFYSGDKYRSAHVLSYEWTIGGVPAGMQIDHLCRNPGCVNPDHLEAVTCRENLLRGQTHAAINAAKTACPRGHVYDTIIHAASGDRRTCSICQRERNRVWMRGYNRRKN